MKPKRINALWGVWLPAEDGDGGCWCDHAQGREGPEAYTCRRAAMSAARHYRWRFGPDSYGWLHCYAAPLTDAAAKIDARRRRKR